MIALLTPSALGPVHWLVKLLVPVPVPVLVLVLVYLLVVVSLPRTAPATASAVRHTARAPRWSDPRVSVLDGC